MKTIRFFLLEKAMSMYRKILLIGLTGLMSLLIVTVDMSFAVTIRDANLRAKIVETLGKARGAQLTTGDMLALTKLEAPNANIQDLDGIQHARNLISLNLGGEYIDGKGWDNSNAISNFSPLKQLAQLASLTLSFSSLSDASFLSGMTQLRSLHLGNNAITDISPLEALTQLTSLGLDGNTIVDVSALAGMTRLRYLYLGRNSISNLVPLAGLTQLTSLNLYSNNISDVSALAGLTQLTSLHLSNNTIMDVSPLAKLTQLTVLDLRNNAVLDVSPLVELDLPGTQWNSTGLYLEQNPLSYASINTHIPTMRAKRVEVKLEPRTPMTLVKILGDAQQGTFNAALPLPFVVEVHDQHNRTFAGVPVTFAITSGSGRLSATTATTDTAGKAQAHLTLKQTTGTTTVRVTVAEITEFVQFTATAIPLSFPVTIRDANLHARIAETLGKPLDETLTAADMLTLTKLTANNVNIRDLTGLQHASNLITLSLDNNDLFDVTPLMGLPRLTGLSLNNNRIWDVAPLAVLTQLKTLSLRNNSILNASPLVGLTHLKDAANRRGLDLRDNPLNDVSIHTHIPALQATGVDVRFDDVLTQPKATVRIVYFLPRDREPQPDIDAKLDKMIKAVQLAYAGIMEGHGFGRKTFNFETDTEGNAVVRHIVGQFTDEHYSNLSHTWDIWKEIDERFDTSKNIYLTVIDISSEALDIGEACGRGGPIGASGGKALILATGHCFNINVTAHELGHAFGLYHDYRGDAKRILTHTYDEMVTSFCAAEWLDAHRAFNPEQSISNPLPTIEMLPPSFAAPPNTIRLRFKVSDPNELHQAQLLANVYGRNS